MLLNHQLTLAVAALLPLAVNAQPQAPDPANVDISVSIPAYESAFRNYQTSGDGQVAPDKIWRDANREVQAMGGHAGPDVSPGNAQHEHAGHDNKGD